MTAGTTQATFLLLALYVGLMMVLAWVGRAKTHNVTDYILGGRSLGGVALGLSFFATYASTNSYLGFSGKAYAYGAPWLLLVPAAVGFSLLAWWLIAPRLRAITEQLGSVTIPDYVGFRFRSRRARFVAAVIVVFSSVLYMTAVYKGIGTLLAAFLGLGYGATLGVVLGVVVLYTAIGGFHSVVRTDVVQALVMVVAAILLFAGFARAAGGLSSLATLPNSAETAALFDWNSALPLPVLLGVVVASTIKFLVEPRQLSRFYALSTPAAARAGLLTSTACFLVVFSLLAPLGLMAHRLQPLLGEVHDTDTLVPTLLASGELFGPIATGFLVLAMVSAAMSSLDSVLLVVATTFERDIVHVIRGHHSERIGATRVYVIAFAAITAAVALRPPAGIVELTAFSGALYGACFFPAIALGLWWRRGDGASVLCSFAVGILVLIGWRGSPLSDGLHEVFPAMAASLIAYIATSLRPGADIVSGVHQKLDSTRASVA